MNELKVPYGLNDEGNLVSSANAVRGVNYYCPMCRECLVHKAGEVKIKHFSHPSGTNCTPESILHKIAKHLIAEAVSQHANGLAVIKLEHHCGYCGLVFEIEIPKGTFTHAEKEVSFSPYVCDVVAYRRGLEPLAVEIFYTHKIGKEKRNNLSIHWLELKAEKVIQNPYYWQPTQSKLKPILCKTCKSDYKHILSVADKWNIPRELYLPIQKKNISPRYIAATETCFKCQEEIPIFWWQGVPFCQTEPPKPRPRTIKLRNSKQWGGSYWANTCANCNMIQGDNHLFIFDGAPFSGLPLYSNNARESETVHIVSEPKSVSEFYKVINRNFPKL